MVCAPCWSCKVVTASFFPPFWHLLKKNNVTQVTVWQWSALTKGTRGLVDDWHHVWLCVQAVLSLWLGTSKLISYLFPSAVSLSHTHTHTHTHTRTHVHTLSSLISTMKLADQRLREHKRAAGHEPGSRGLFPNAQQQQEAGEEHCSSENRVPQKKHNNCTICCNDATTAKSYWKFVSVKLTADNNTDT